MPQRTRNRQSPAPLIVIICVLAAMLAAVLYLALVVLPDLQQSPDPTQPPTTAPTEAPTHAPTQPPLEGWQQQDGHTYYYVAGTPLTGAFEADGKLFVAGADGKLLPAGWQDVDDRRYYLNADSSAVTGWQEIDNQRYYFRADGTMARGNVQIDGVTWHFSSQGISFVMVNPWNFLPEDYAPTLVDLPRELGEGHRVDESAYDDLVRMLRECNAAMKEEYKNSGKKIPQAYVISSYRTMEDQTNAYNNKIQRVMNANPGMTREEAEKEAATVVAYPGTSEHQTGLAVDIIDTQLWALEQEQEDLPAQQWLMANCWRYGFLLRYPEGKTDSTGIIYEPWHYRYLGIELATEIHQSGLTVEQYLESLS